MNVEEYRGIVYEDIELAVNANGSNQTTEFLSYVTGILINGEEFDDFIDCHYDGITRRNGYMAIDGYSVDETDGSCCLFIVDYHGKNEDDSIKSEDVNSAFKKLRKTYKCYDVHVAFDKWSKDVLKSKAYSSYKECKCIARGNVIVIFAGYPDRMGEFLDQNEGLRSRIAFHLNFPDYNGDELTSILKLMAKNRGLKLDNKAVEKCRSICEKACTEKEFGNGRFVRNLLEQAVLKQSQRLYDEYKNKEIPKTSVERLEVSDFEVNLSDVCLKKKANTIGFAI